MNYYYEPGDGYCVTFGDLTTDAIYTRKVALFDANGVPLVRNVKGALVRVDGRRVVWHPNDRNGSGPMTPTVAARLLPPRAEDAS